jgi:hypothetical protein
MMSHRQFRSPSPWTWLLPVAATTLIAACDTSLADIDAEGTWGFVTVTAQKSPTGAHFANTIGQFFKGNLAAVPNAEFVADTCADVAFTDGNSLGGVTFLDAGPTVSATLGGVAGTLDRISTSEGLAYKPPGGPIPFTPGDSIFVTTTGVAGGYPAGAIRAKTAEAFTFPTNIPVPPGSEAIQLTWSAPHDVRSAMVVSLRYATASNPTQLTRNVLCQFIDDGVDSIPFRWHSTWSTSQGLREVVATRLRTSYVSAGNGNLGVISTYQVPTPPHN